MCVILCLIFYKQVVRKTNLDKIKHTNLIKFIDFYREIFLWVFSKLNLFKIAVVKSYNSIIVNLSPL